MLKISDFLLGNEFMQLYQKKILKTLIFNLKAFENEFKSHASNQAKSSELQNFKDIKDKDQAGKNRGKLFAFYLTGCFKFVLPCDNSISYNLQK